MSGIASAARALRGRRGARVLRPRHVRWLLTLYPPLFFNRVRCTAVAPDFRRCTMRVARSLLTRNLNGTTFGGSIFAAADPVYALLFWQIFAHEGTAVQVWLRSATVEYVKPAASRLVLDCAIPEADVDEARAALARDGRWRKAYRIDAVDVEGATCATITTEVYMRLARPAQPDVSGF